MSIFTNYSQVYGYFEHAGVILNTVMEKSGAILNTLVLSTKPLIFSGMVKNIIKTSF